MKKTQKRSWELIFTHFNFDSFALYKMYLQNYFAHTSREKRRVSQAIYSIRIRVRVVSVILRSPSAQVCIF